MASHDGPEGGKLWGFFDGVIIANDHPQKAGWVRIRIPGLIENGTGWAKPAGNPGGGGSNLRGARRGMIATPKVGAAVICGFIQGDVQTPFFFPGNYGSNVGGSSEVPGPVGGYAKVNRDTAEPGAPEDIPAADAPLIFAHETDNYVIIIDDRPGKRRLVIQDKNTGDGVTMDGERKNLEIVGMSNVTIRSDGILSLNGIQVVINGRAVLAGEKPLGS